MTQSAPDSTRQTLPFTLRRGQSPLLVSMPHVGTFIPTAVATQMTDEALELADTDWHLPLLYGFLEQFDATVLTATYSRLVVDLNRPPDDANLYPGQDTTRLVPADTFRKQPVYVGQTPGTAEVARRVTSIWRPYHHALETELARLRERHSNVVLWDAHSIASELPRFFEGRLTDLNFGTVDGASCAPGLTDAILDPVKAQNNYSWVLNGRFKGGTITRTYGAPQTGLHAVQLEMSQIIYMNEATPFAYLPDLASQLAPLLQRCLGNAVDWASRPA